MFSFWIKLASIGQATLKAKVYDIGVALIKPLMPNILVNMHTKGIKMAPDCRQAINKAFLDSPIPWNNIFVTDIVGKNNKPMHIRLRAAAPISITSSSFLNKDITSGALIKAKRHNIAIKKVPKVIVKIVDCLTRL